MNREVKKIIVFHKNCMDGIASAFIAKEAFEDIDILVDVKTQALQYGDENELFMLLDNIKKDFDLEIYFLDFSLKRDLMIFLCSRESVKKVVVIDHHKTAKENLRDLEKEVKNIEIVFDMNKSGATLTYDYFKSNLSRQLFDYIEDRDLWKWKLPFSKQISEALKLYVKPNDLDNFAMVYDDFDFEKYSTVGTTLLSKMDLQVSSKIKKVSDKKIFGINFKIINATENISEIGNEICLKYNTPSMMYFFTEKNEVICSFRSIDALPDVSVIANSLGGGGHRNACGATLTILDFYELILKEQE